MNTIDKPIPVAANARTVAKSTGSEASAMALKSGKPNSSYVADTLDNLICFSHLRWDFVYQRPQHLLTRAAHHCRVWFIEEPIWVDPSQHGSPAHYAPGLEMRSVNEQLTVIIPYLPQGISPDEARNLQRQMLDQLLAEQRIQNYGLWYYTPMALLFSDHLQPRITVYDCMDELSAFLNAPPTLIEQERLLLQRADVVFAGGYSLYEAKQKHHQNVYAFPSCIDFDHFAQCRPGLGRPGLARPGLGRHSQSRPSQSRPGGMPFGLHSPPDLAGIPGPRIGYCGVIDERLNLRLINDLAQFRPDWHFIFVGPVAKIDPRSLPQGPNLHYLGMKRYDELPCYFSNWQVAIMPFAINEATRYISPTKTPEYLAAGLPVVSTPVRDVVRTYGGWERVVIADSVSSFQRGISLVLKHSACNDLPKLDAFLREQSWDNTWQQMHRILSGHLVGVGFDQ